MSKIACGTSHTLCIDKRGVVRAFGLNTSGQLGLGDEIERKKPHRIKELFTCPIVYVACGASFSICVDSNGVTYSFGDNSYGQLGLGNQTSHFTPTKIDTLPPSICSAFCGSEHVYFLEANGNLWVCGKNEEGQLGVGDTKPVLSPKLISLHIEVYSVACGSCHSILMSSTGRVYGCGFNNTGQLGLGDYKTRYKFVQLPEFDGIPSISCGSFHTVLLDQEGDVYVVGQNVDGQLGLGDNRARITPEMIPNLPPIAKISCLSYATLLIDIEGNVWGCGKTFGSTAQIIPDLSDIYFVSEKGHHVFAKDKQGTIWVFGRNNAGQLGIGETFPQYRNKPVEYTKPTILDIPGFSRAKSAKK